MGFFGRPKPPVEEPLLQDFEVIKAAAELRIAGAARIREEQERAQKQADILVRVAASQGEVGDILDGRETGNSISYPEIQIDETTQIIIPENLRTTDLYSKKVSGDGELLIVNINREMLENLAKINIEIQTSSGNIITQLHKIIKINGRNMSLFEYISQSPSTPVTNAS